MGRYYTGDINGKFWFGVQNSYDANFFGGFPSVPNYVEYYFDTDNIEEIKNGIRVCEKRLGEHLEPLNAFFKEKDSYNDKELAEVLEVSQSKLKYLLAWYARLELGDKILKCVLDNGVCSFEAEL